jgi:hypothetical protein
MNNIQNKSPMFKPKPNGLGWTPANKNGWIITCAMIVSILALTSIFIYDIQQFDGTKGGYTYPYSDYTGTPYDFTKFEVNSVGLRNANGIVIEFQINCTTGMITGFLGPIAIDYRVLSERDIAIHKPQIACKENGFTPQWKY